jgi:hypothetical protein
MSSDARHHSSPGNGLSKNTVPDPRLQPSRGCHIPSSRAGSVAQDQAQVVGRRLEAESELTRSSWPSICTPAPRLVTSVISGAVTCTTSVPVRPETASWVTLVEHRLGVGARWQDGQGPVDLEPQLGHRPDRVVGLHLGQGDAGGGALGRIIEHHRCPADVSGGLLVHGR